MVGLRQFIPAEFDLYEFEDSKATAGRSTARKRWFSQFHGLVGESAEEVGLGWSAGDSVVIVCTSGRRYDRAEARARAAHLALGGDALPIPGRPQGPLAAHQAIDEFENADELWTAVGDTPSAAETAEGEGFSIGYRRLENGGLGFIAAVNVDPLQFRIQRVQNWEVYDIDPRSTFPLSALSK